MVRPNVSLHNVLEKAYEELGEKRRDTDSFFCKNGTSLMELLDKKIQSVLKSKCKGEIIEIRGDTGGA